MIFNFPTDCNSQELFNELQNIADSNPEKFTITYFSVINGDGGLYGESSKGNVRLHGGHFNCLELNLSLIVSILTDTVMNFKELTPDVYLKIYTHIT